MNAPLRIGPAPEVLTIASLRRRIELNAAVDELAAIRGWGHQFDDATKEEMRDAAQKLMEMANGDA